MICAVRGAFLSLREALRQVGEGLPWVKTLADISLGEDTLVL